MVAITYPSAAMPSQRPTMGLKRDSSHLSSPSSSDSLASQTKRLKVAFDDKIDVRILDDWSVKPQELVREEVRAALDSHARANEVHDDATYEQLRTLLANALFDASARGRDTAANIDRPSTSLLRQYIAALLGRVNDLKGCGTLVHAALDVSWFGRDESFVALYVRFMGALCSAMPGFLKPAMERIVRLFTALPAAYSPASGEAEVSRRQMLTRLHNALRYLLRLVPAATGALSELLRNEFPNHRNCRQRAYLFFVKNLFRITDYAPELRSDVLTIVTERLVKIDIEVQEEIEDLEDDAEEDLVAGVKKEHGDITDDSDAESEADSDLDDSAEDRQLRTLRESVAKLDSVLDLLFDYYTTTFIDANRFESEDAFDQLLSLFTTYVLPTYRSRHTQFLIFHFAQISQRNTARFVSHCMQIATGHNTSASSSIFAAAYLASFIARGNKVPKYIVREVVAMLGAQLLRFQRTYEPTCRGPDLGRYALFYTCAQALLYIFCFRWRDLIVLSEYDTEAELDDYDVFASGEPNWVPGLKESFTRAIYSRLNPLKVCSPLIVNQFAAIANHLRFMFVYPLLETNKRLRLSSYRSYGGVAASGAIGKRESALSSKSGEEHHQLDAFFPFDPFQLPKSKRWLGGDYNEWKGVPGMKVEEEDDDSEDEESDDGSEVDDEDGGVELDDEDVGSESS